MKKIYAYFCDMISVVILGAGNVATHLFRAFKKANGVTVVQWYKWYVKLGMVVNFFLYPITFFFIRARADRFKIPLPQLLGKYYP